MCSTIGKGKNLRVDDSTIAELFRIGYEINAAVLWMPLYTTATQIYDNLSDIYKNDR